MTDSKIPKNPPSEAEEKRFNQIAYIGAYNKQNYDSITIRLPKGSRETLKKAASQKGYSVAGYIARLIREDEVSLP